LLDKLTCEAIFKTLEPVLSNLNVIFYQVNICDRTVVFGLFKEYHPDIVVNFAAESHMDRSIEDPGIF
jgi:dTDP-glucose 4,6-dehydratase